MTRALYIRNLLIFSVFVALIFATPFVFAEDSAPQLRLNNIQLPLHSRYNRAQQQAVLGQNTVLQLPDEVAQHMVYRNGTLDLEATLKIWDDLADQGRTPGKRNGLYPVKVVVSPDSSVDTSAKTAIGYIDMSALMESNASFGLTRTDMEDTIVAEEASPDDSTVGPINQSSHSYGEEVFGSYDEMETPADLKDGEGGEGDATIVDPGPPPTRPVSRPERPPGDMLQTQAALRCDNSWNYSLRTMGKTSCFAKRYGYSGDGLRGLKEKVQHILNDLEAINRGRAPRVTVDPRFSLCIAENESRLSPNATNGNDWGLYQINQITGVEAIENFDPITPGFEHLNTEGEYSTYRQKMLTSTLAQADLHHSVILKKAEYAGKLQKMGQGTMTNEDYRQIAIRYNARRDVKKRNGASQSYKYHYGNMVTDCFRALQPLVSEYGQIADGVTNQQLRTALDKAHW